MGIYNWRAKAEVWCTECEVQMVYELDRGLFICPTCGCTKTGHWLKRED